MKEMIKGFILLIFVVSIIFLVVFAITVSLTNYVEKVNCRTMESQGFEVKLFNETKFTNICLVKINDKINYLPYEKIRVVD